jgi:hypothetical protein
LCRFLEGVTPRSAGRRDLLRQHAGAEKKQLSDALGALGEQQFSL